MNELSLEKFVGIYVNSVIDAIQLDGSLTMQEFYNKVFASVSRRTDLSERELLSLHHVFHWSLFLRPDSSLDLVSSRNGESYTVALRKKVIRRDEETSRVLSNYGLCLQAKIEKLYESRINT